MLASLLQAIAPPLCAGCGASAGRIEPLCTRCRDELRWLAADPVTVGGVTVWAPVAYEGPAQGLVRALKFRGATRAANAMAAAVVANAPRGWLERPAHLVPVPLHPARARKRGYNQAALLAAAIGGRTGLPVADCLTRTGPRGTQVGRDRSQRLAGIEGTVRVNAEVPRRALVVDDVITTGATVAACAAALVARGTGSVAVVGYARTPGR